MIYIFNSTPLMFLLPDDGYTYTMQDITNLC